MTVTLSDLQRARRGAQQRDATYQDRRGTIGRLIAGERVIFDTPRPGHVWVTFSSIGGKTDFGSYFCKVAPSWGSHVLVGPDRDGITKVLSTDDRANVETFGTRAITLGAPMRDLNLRGDAGYDLIREHRLDILRLTPTAPASMRLRYEGGLVQHNGAYYWIPAGLTADLTSYIPVSGKCLLAIGLDMPSKALVYAAGTTVASVVPLAESDLVAITLTGSGTVLLLGGVILTAGQAEIAADTAASLIHLHPWLTAAAAAENPAADTSFKVVLQPNASVGGSLGAWSFGTNGWSLPTIAYDPDSQESAQWSVPLPATLPAGFTATLTLHWSTAGSSGDVLWQATTLSRADDETLDAAGIDDTFTADTVLAALDEHTCSKVLTSTGWAAGELLMIRITRVAADEGDTLTSDAFLLNAILEIAEVI